MNDKEMKRFMERAKAFIFGPAGRERAICLLVFLLATIAIAGKATPVKAENATVPPSFAMMMQLNVYSIDLKTDTLYSQYYSFEMSTSDPAVQSFVAVVLRPDSQQAVGMQSWNESNQQVVREQINTDPQKVTVPWQWHLNPQRPFVLGTPLDSYEISFLIAVNMSTELNFNDGTVFMPVYLRGEWVWSSDIRAEKLAAAPSNQTLTSLGLSVEKFYARRCNNMSDFYLFTVNLSSPFMNSMRTTIAFFLPSIVILAVLTAATFKRNILKRTDFLTIFMGAGLFTLSFLISFYQYAPPDIFTWEELFLIINFVFAATLAVYSIVRTEKAEPTEKATTHPQKHNEKKQEQGPRLVEIGRSIDKAFEWFVLLLSVLIGVLFAFLTWITKPEANLDITTKFMCSLTAPLVLTICTWLWSLLTLSEERQIRLRLFSWNSISMIFAYYIMLFSTFVTLGVSPGPFGLAAAAAVVILISGVVVVLFPSKRIIGAYKAVTPENNLWKNKRAVALTYVLGAGLTGILILLPFVFP
jgi:hypothetical protein